MTKRQKLSNNQSRRINANLHKRLKQNQAESDTDLAECESGLVISRFGQHADVEWQTQIIRCNIRRTVKSVVVGDEVVWRKADDNEDGLGGVIEAVAPRHSQLTRPDYYDGIKIVAANIDQVVIVSAVLPEFSANILDRYLVAVEDLEITPLLVLNKTDLLDELAYAQLQTQLQPYRELGYIIVEVSTKSGDGLATLRNHLLDKKNVFVGQSGVGKSSLTNALLPGANIDTKVVSENSGLGQHTTTTARLYHLPEGGDLVDSPGIREFGLWHLEPERVTWCFVEFRDYLGGCKFRDCKHLNDPGCIIQQAAKAGDISPARLESYHRIIQSMKDDKPTRHFPTA